MVARMVIISVSLGSAVLLSLIGLFYFYTESGDSGIGRMMAVFVWIIAAIFLLLAAGTWMAGKNKSGEKRNSLDL